MLWILLHIIHFKNEWERPTTLFLRDQQSLPNQANWWKDKAGVPANQSLTTF